MKDDINIIKLLNVVALLEDIPEKNLVKGEVGTIVEALGKDSFEVEFSTKQGQTTNYLTLQSKDFIVLHFKDEVAF